MIRRRRPFAAVLAIVALLFAQLLMSAHACDMPSQGRSSGAMVHGEGCPGAAQDETPGGNLCEQHCQYGAVSVDSDPPDQMAMSVVTHAFKVEAAVAAASPPSRRNVSLIVAPPATILFGVLRI